MLTEFDLHLIGEGRHWKSYEKLGAQLDVVDGVAGTNFAVWAPNADRVCVVGDFNGWQGAALERSGDAASGVWSVSLPLAAGRYEYAFVVDGNRWIADPALPRMHDEFGGEHSVLRLGADRVM